MKNLFVIFIFFFTLLSSEVSYSKTYKKFCNYFDKEEILDKKNVKFLQKQFKKNKLRIKDTHLNVMKKFFFTIKTKETDQQDVFIAARDLCNEIKIFISQEILQNFNEKNSDIAQIKTTKKDKKSGSYDNSAKNYVMYKKITDSSKPSTTHKNKNKSNDNNKELLTAKILNDYTLKDHFLGDRDTEFKVKKDQIYKIIVLKENDNFALITNTKDWKKKGSIEGWIPLKYLKIQNENYVFNNKNTNKIKNENIEEIATSNSTQVIKQTIKTEKDLEGPNILVANTFKANNELTASIEGRVTDQSVIVSLEIDGDEVSIVNGIFNKELYVFPDGQDVQIIARDKHGNKSETTVKLVRATEVVQEDRFDFPDPRKIKAKTNKNAVAIIIGIEKYENTFAAPFATNDAVTFNDFARLSLGIPANNIKLLTNDEAERNDTLRVLRTWLPKKIIDNQTELYVFYSGHGLASEDGSDLYLLPADGEPDILEDTTILRNKMFDIIAELNPKRVTMFFDTCYSGATRDEEFLVAAKPIFIEAVEQDIPTNFNIFSASSGRETAKILKEAEHGLFSYYMMKGLEGDADVNNDNQITNGELIAFVNKNVSRQANQTPQFNGDPDQVLVQW